MWELHKLIKSSGNKQYLIDEAIFILQNNHPADTKTALRLMYDTVSLDNPLRYGLMLIKGLQANKFFEFQDFVEKLSGSPK